MLQSQSKQDAIIYDRSVERSSEIFKPGNNYFYEFDGEVLNANVPWFEVFSEILSHGWTAQRLSRHLDLKPTILDRIVEKQDLSLLDFKTGARLLALHQSV